MTTIDVDTSPLQAAREWRGIGLVAAAMNSGLPVAQAEALEEGDPQAFTSIDEMIAAAVVYGASIGIGRDEAMALLDRTVTRVGGVQVELPEGARPNEAFSDAVQERSSRMTAREDVAVSAPIVVDDEPEVADLPVFSHMIEEPAVPSLDLPEVPIGPEGPTPEQAVAASGELHLDGAFSPDVPWERAEEGFGTGELEAWADDFDEYEAPGRSATRERNGDSLAARAGATSYAAIERLVGTDRADAIADRTRDTTARIGEFARTSRERLRRSEHATLFVAIGAGAILIAIVVALGGALGNDEPAGPGPAAREATAEKSTAAETTDAAATAGAAKADATAAKPIIPPARLTLDIFNAGSKKGYAKEVAAKLDGYGYKIGEVTNAKSDYTGASIIHPADMSREARVLARRTGISTLQVAPGSSRKITIVVT